jgi:hypothetical protein
MAKEAGLYSRCFEHLQLASSIRFARIGELSTEALGLRGFEGTTDVVP